MCMNETETREDKVGVGVGRGKSGLSDGRNNVILYPLIFFGKPMHPQYFGSSF